MLELTAHLHAWIPILAAALVAASLILYRRTEPPLGARRRALLATLRIGAFAVLAFLLAAPVVVSRRVESRRPVAVVLLDRSRSMAVRDADGRARIDAALADAANLRTALESAGASVAVLPFASALAPAPLPRGAAVAADGDGTDIRGAVDAAVKRYRGDGLAAVVVLSDGRVTRGMTSAGRPPGAPVIAVGYGDTASAAGVTIEDVIVDRIAYRGTAIPVEAVVRARGARGGSVELRLLENGRLRRGATLPVRRDDEILSAALEYAPEREGRARITVEAVVSAGGTERGRSAESVRIDVRAERLRLLYIDRFADWNTAFLRDLVARSKRLAADIALGKAGGGFAIEPDGRAWTFPREASGLEPYDLVVVSDDAGSLASRPAVDALSRYVEKGGSVLFLADEQSPLVRPGSFGLLEPILPLRRERTPRAEYAPCVVRAAPGASTHPLGAELAAGEGLDRLPPLPARVAGVAAAPDATVPLVIEAGGAVSPFVALARRGDGASAAVLGFPLWRWKLAGDEGAARYESLLGGLVLFLAEGARSGAVVLDADRTEYRAGDRVRLAAFIGERRPPEAIRGDIERKGGEGSTLAGTVVFSPDPRRRGLYRAEAAGLPPGEYRVAATAIEAGGAAGPAGSTEFSISPASVELLDSSRDASCLSGLAAESGGAYLESADARAVVARVDLSPRRAELASSRELRGELPLFIVIVALLGAEWMARKAWGLV